MPRYVDHWGLGGSLAPALCSGARLYGFVLDADGDALDRVAARTLREPSENRLPYRPYRSAPFVFVTFAHIARLEPASCPASDMGRIEQTEVAFWIPLDRSGPGELPRPVLHIPHIFVDRGEAMRQGREVYGFPKQLASFHFDTEDGRFPRGNLEPGRITIRTDGVRRFSADAVWGPIDLVELLPVRSNGRVPVTSKGKDYPRLGEDILDVVVTAFAQGVRPPIPPEGRLALLKQFPAVEDTTRAVHQSIVEAAIHVEHFERGGFLGQTYGLRIADADSHPIVRDLGLRPADPAAPDMFVPRVAWWADLSFTLAAGETVWPPFPPRASPPGKAPSPQQAAPTPATPRASSPKRRVAILGGGVGAMTAAYWMTHPDNPESANLDVTVWQLGARLGGKGASARNEARGQRIEEHGLHTWFGFYYNAVRTMRDCYAELAGSPEAGEFLFDANFEGHGQIVLGEQVGGTWRSFGMPFPPLPARDGTLDADELAGALVEWLQLFLSQLPLTERLVSRRDRWTARTIVGLGNVVARLWHRTRKRPPSAHDHGRGHRGAVAPWRRCYSVGLLRKLADKAGDALFFVERLLLRDLLQRLRQRLEPGAETDDRRRRLWIAVDLALATARGFFKDDVLVRGFDHLDRDTLTEWLQRHGAHRDTLESAWVQSMYRIVFAFHGGRTDQPDIGAGTVLRSALRMLFAYRDSFLWKMKAGMGDVVFAPLYTVLRRRGVRFEFFHRVRTLEVDDPGQTVARIRLGRQVRLRDPERGYDPLVDIGGRACWPRRPDTTQFCDEDAQRFAAMERDPGAEGLHLFESAWSPWGEDCEDEVVLECGRDFDEVVLGIPPGALETIGADLARRSPNWKRMLSEVKTVRTQAFQVWLRRDIDDLAGGLGFPLRGSVATGYALPIDSWGDLSQTLPAERWTDADGNAPKAVAYFCGVLADDDNEPAPQPNLAYAAGQRAKVFEAMRATLRDGSAAYWPAARAQGDFDWSLLFDSERGPDAGEELLGRQYWTANIDPHERYVLSVRGSVLARLRPEAGLETGFSGFLNLHLAGDWTRNGLNAGFVESAVVSGMRAARSVSRWYRLPIEGETDFRNQRPEGLPPWATVPPPPRSPR